VERTSQDPLKLTFNGKGKGNYSVIKVFEKTKATKGKPVKAMKAIEAMKA
jgi:hypothetical protein